jgi:transposase
VQRPQQPAGSPEVIERTVWMVFDAKDQYPLQWAAIESIADKIGCTAETLRKRVRQVECDSPAQQAQASTAQAVVRLHERKRDIASQLAITPETLLRPMHSFARRGVIEVSGYLVRELDTTALGKLAQA